MDKFITFLQVVCAVSLILLGVSFVWLESLDRPCEVCTFEGLKHD